MKKFIKNGIMIMHQCIQVVHFRRIDFNPGMYALEFFSSPENPDTAPQPGSRLLHLAAGLTKRTDSCLPADSFPDRALLTCQMILQQVILMIAVQQD